MKFRTSLRDPKRLFRLGGWLSRKPKDVLTSARAKDGIYYNCQDLRCD